MSKCTVGTDGSFENSIIISEVLLSHKCTFKSGEITTIYKDGRNFSGFMCPIAGTVVYKPFCADEFTVSPGDIVYLPAMSRYTIESGEMGCTHYTINFIIDAGESDKINRLAGLFGDVPLKITTESFDEFRNVFSKAVNAFGANIPGSTLLMKAKIMELIYMFFSEPPSRDGSKGEYEALIMVKGYIDGHFCESISARELSRLCSMSETGLRRKFRELMGQPPLDYQTGLRIRRARELLLERRYNVAEVARLVGFEDVNYFSRLFKKRVGVSPSVFEKMY